MADEIPGSAGKPGRTPLEERVSADKRQFLRLVLGSMTAYSVPLMASFSMEGLRFGTARAGNFVPPFCPPGLADRDELPPGQPFTFGNQPRGRPFTDPTFQPPSRPFNPEEGDCFFISNATRFP